MTQDLLNDLLKGSRDVATLLKGDDVAKLTWGNIWPLVPPEIRRIVLAEIHNQPVTAAESRLRDEWSEDFLASAGYGVISRENGKIVERFEAGLPCSLGELEAVLFDYWSGPIAEYFPRKEFA